TSMATQQETSQSVSAIDNSLSDDIQPELLSIVHNAQFLRNEDQNITFQITWRHNNTNVDSVNVYVCKEGDVFGSGCAQEKLYETSLTKTQSGQQISTFTTFIESNQEETPITIGLVDPF